MFWERKNYESLEAFPERDKEVFNAHHARD
jgi:hypothetical protein